MSRRNLILLTALLLTTWLAWRAPSESNAITLTERVKNTATQADASQTILSQTNHAEAVPVLVMQKRTIAPSQFNLFAVEKPLVVKNLPKTTAKSYAVVQAIAPPLPFKLIGRMQVGEEGSQAQSNQALLNINDEVTPVAVGDVLLGQYKVLAIQNKGSDTQVQMLYLPLKQVQTLNALSIH